MASSENQEITYESQFTIENMVKLKQVINAAVNAYAEKEFKGGTIDLFLILASLGQTAFEAILLNLTNSDEHRKEAMEKMQVATDRQLINTDTLRKELQLDAAAELMAAIHTFSVIAEWYSKRRDEVQSKVNEEAKAIVEAAQQAAAAVLDAEK